MQFIVATCDYSGLGFAIRLQAEGHRVLLATHPSTADQTTERRTAYDLVGQNIVEKVMLQDLIAQRTDFRDAYWIWDHNHSVEENETLREKGFRVLGGGRYSDMMEHDRYACLEHAAIYGLLAPPSHRFENTADAIHFCRDGYVLIVNGFGYTIQTAWENVANKADQIRFAYRQYRPDGADNDYPSSPLRRWQALNAMGYL